MHLLGETKDDAVGEAFDKAAKMLELPYPGGPAVDKLAKQGDPEYLKFPKGRIKGSELDFSYSGLKTAVLYHLQSLSPEDRKNHQANVAASFQKAAIEILIEKSLKALGKYRIAQFALAGGVACNSYLRQRLQDESEKNGFRLFIPPMNLCTDNAAMVVRAGKFYLEQGQRSDFSLSPMPSLSLSTTTT